MTIKNSRNDSPSWLNWLIPDGRSALLKTQTNVGVGTPEARQLRFTEFPSVTDWFIGGSIIWGDTSIEKKSKVSKVRVVQFSPIYPIFDKTRKQQQRQNIKTKNAMFKPIFDQGQFFPKVFFAFSVKRYCLPLSCPSCPNNIHPFLVGCWVWC